MVNLNNSHTGKIVTLKRTNRKIGLVILPITIPSFIHKILGVDKIGDLKLFSSLDSDDEIHIIYKDGTSSDIESYYDPFLTNLEEIFIPLFGPW